MTPAAGDARSRKLICLAGFMGCGKTTVGRLLAKQAGWHFVDLDERIEERAGLSIPAIFDRLGEPGFRDTEAESLVRALGEAGARDQATVLALGGGTLTQPENLARLRASGAFIIWLDCPVNELLARCATMTNRPLFRDEASFRKLYAERLPCYQQADFRVTSDSEPRHVVEQILALGIPERVTA